MALYRSPLTVTLWPSSFLKKYGPMIPPAHKAHQTVSFSGFNDDKPHLSRCHSGTLVRLFRGAMGAEFLFPDDNARPHRANIVDECFQSEDITRMDWPAYSPDLNPIKHVWDMLGRRIADRQPPPTCLPELRRALLDEWWPRLCKACIASSGRHTPY
ncbi:transposable element Tcb1 transposase [Trichonephila clavipes]|nr:transposable element Tcb1 transposase [Trichonephila clavipes]